MTDRPHLDEGGVPLEPPEIRASRERAARALRRMGHAMVGYECDPALLEQIAVRADRIAAEVELGTPRSRPVESIKRRLWENPPPEGGPMTHFPECVVSGSANPMGVAMRVRREGDDVVADVRLGPAFEGAPKRAHGGITAAVFDDLMGYVLMLYRTPAYTAQLTVNYRAPVPIGEDLRVRARLSARDGDKLEMVAEMQACGEHDQPVVADAQALFVAIPPERLGLDPRTLPPAAL